jgi:hypothetical protein
MRRATAVALTVALIAVPAATTDAKSKKPKPPSTATIKKLLKNAYCPPGTGKSVTVTFNSMKRGKARIGSAALDGTPANRKTWVFPIRAKYFCDYRYTNNSTPEFKANDLRIKGDYSFFRDEFGTWVQKNHGHDVQTVPGNN